MNNILFKRRGVRLASVYLRIVITNSVNSEATMECVILVRTLVRGTKKKRRNPVIDKWNLSIAPSMDDFNEQLIQMPSSCVLFSKRFEVRESTIRQSPKTWSYRDSPDSWTKLSFEILPFNSYNKLDFSQNIFRRRRGNLYRTSDTAPPRSSTKNRPLILFLVVLHKLNPPTQICLQARPWGLRLRYKNPRVPLTKIPRDRPTGYRRERIGRTNAV